MRILLTKKGQETLKRIRLNQGDETDFPSTLQHSTHSLPYLKNPKKLAPYSSQKAPKSRSPASPKSPHRQKFHTTRNLEKEKSVSNIIDIIDSSPGYTTRLETDNSCQGNKEIKIKTKKILIGKKAIERYNTESEGPSLILPITHFHSEGNDNDTSELKQEYSIREIIGKEGHKNLIESAKNSHIEKQKHFVINENNFRTDSEEQFYLKRLESNLTNKLSTDKMNLINYLTKSRNLTEVIVDKIAHADESRMLKMNKACQISNHMESLDEIFQRELQYRVKKKEREMVIEYKKNLQNMSHNLELFGARLNPYEKVKLKNEEAYKDNFLNIQRKYWNVKIDKLYNPKNKKNDETFFTDRSTINQAGSNIVKSK